MLLAPSTQVGGSVIFFLVDSADFMDGFPYSPVALSSDENITPQNVLDGKIISLMWTSSPGGSKYLVADLFDFQFNEIAVIDDHTIRQPAHASCVFNSADSSFDFSPNALGLRLGMHPEGLEEHSISGVSISPNPTNGPIAIKNENALDLKVRIAKVSGTEIMHFVTQKNSELDLSRFGKGTYVLRIDSNQGAMSRKIVVD
jgi:hypothetical protein